ncbi:hypothetical protein SDC9_160006 [bioreactor metagenome]|uniref:Uncharacterized protein n=1 Tax=bioreactor metagenome TaxID=1076179 RepID=A0A645FEG3_9ZZZZ
MIYYLFWSAYTTRVSTENFNAFFGVSLTKMYRFELWLAKVFRLTTKDNGQYQLTDKGAYYFHYFERNACIAFHQHFCGIESR